MKYLSINEKRFMMIAAAAAVMVAILATPDTILYASSGSGAVDLAPVTNPIIQLLRSILGPIIALVGAVGTIYCVLLGVKFAKAEEPQEREKAKAHLKNAIIGFVLIFVLIVALNQSLPILQEWMTRNM